MDSLINPPLQHIVIKPNITSQKSRYVRSEMLPDVNGLNKTTDGSLMRATIVNRRTRLKLLVLRMQQIY